MDIILWLQSSGTCSLKRLANTKKYQEENENYLYSHEQTQLIFSHEFLGLIVPIYI